MKTIFMAMVLAALLVSGPAVGFFPDVEEIAESGPVEVNPDTAPEGAPAAEGSSEDAAPETDQPAGQTLDDGTKKTQPPMDVTRHRPGACPEGPPCKEGD